MVSSFLWREFAAFLDEIPELGLASLELAALVIRRYPIGDFVSCLLSISPSSRAILRAFALTIFAILLEEKDALKIGFENRLRVAEGLRILMSIKERNRGQLRLFYALAMAGSNGCVLML